MQIWINTADTLLLMDVSKLPSPRAAQKYRVENLYEGPMDDEAAMAIRACDNDGPLMVRVSKKVQTKDKGRLFFGVWLPLQRHHLHGAKGPGPGLAIQAWFQGGSEHSEHSAGTEQISDVPCGNTVALVGVDQ